MILPSQYYEESLYPLQDGVIKILSGCGTDFYLTGGTALSRAYYNHRYSDDLDFFVNNNNDYLAQLKEIFSKLKENGFTWDTDSNFITYDTFTSFRVRWNKSDALLKLDFVNDNAEYVGEIIETDFYYRTDCIRNMISNKISAIYRFAAKDVADIREIGIREKINWVQAINDARQKEAGVELSYVTQILSSMPKSEFDTIVWTNPPSWEEFQEDIKKITYDMLNS